MVAVLGPYEALPYYIHTYIYIHTRVVHEAVVISQCCLMCCYSFADALLISSSKVLTSSAMWIDVSSVYLSPS
jgi:hypothetical protein